jgi:CheY-like chemotaxis protein
MSDPTPSEADAAPVLQEMRVVKLIGFSLRDRELLRLFLRRPPRAGVSLTVIEDSSAEPVDLLIVNVATPESREVLRDWGGARPAIGIVERFETDATYYQITQDGQMLFSLAQAINRIRAGWKPPIPVAAPSPESDVVAAQLSEAAAPETKPTTRVAPRAAVASTTAESTPAAAVSVSAGLPWQRALNILVIDDSHFSREAISVALVKVGFAVDTAEDGKEGLRLASEKLFDVALVDFEMPGMQGPEVLRKLRALGAKAPTLLIMLTSRTGAVDRLRAKFAGCDAYMTKPTRMQEFLKILRDFAIAGKLTRS